VVTSPKPTTPSSQPSSSSSPSSSSTSLEQENKVLQRLPCDMAPRSPTLPTGILRRSRSLNSPESFRAQPAPVARLMGLSDIPPMTTAELALAEKRRRLLGALEKCDEDLKALKKIIDVVKSSSMASTGDDDDDEGRSERGNDLPLLPQPSPVSVLDEFTRSALSGFSKRYTINGKFLFSSLITILLLIVFVFSFGYILYYIMHVNTIIQTNIVCFICFLA